MAPKEKSTLTADECIEIAERLAAAFEDAIATTKAKLTGETRLLVGFRGALTAVRGETTAAWMSSIVSRALGYKGVTDDPEGDDA